MFEFVSNIADKFNITTFLELKSVTQECTVDGVLTSTAASTDWSCDYSDVTTNPVNPHFNEAYRKHLKKEGDSSESSSPGGPREVDKNPTYGTSNTQIQQETATGSEVISTKACQAYGSMENMAYDASSSVNYDADNDYMDCREHSYVETCHLPV